jgi:hypothetical protein
VTGAQVELRGVTGAQVELRGANQC